MDQLREFLRLLKRQHFWFLAPVLLLLGLVGWWLSSKKLSAEFDKYRSEVDGYSSQLRRVSGEEKHPNKDYHDGMEAMIQQRRDNVRTAWQTKWERQKQELKWPEELPEDFRRQVEQLRPIEKVDPDRNREQDIPASLRRTYGGFIKNVLPTLAAAMGIAGSPNGSVPHARCKASVANRAREPPVLPLTATGRTNPRWSAGMREINRCSINGSTGERVPRPPARCSTHKKISGCSPT